MSSSKKLTDGCACVSAQAVVLADCPCDGDSRLLRGVGKSRLGTHHHASRGISERSCRCEDNESVDRSVPVRAAPFTFCLDSIGS